MLNKILNMWFVGSFHVFPVLKMKIAHAIAARRGHRSRSACRPDNSSSPKRRRVSRCAFAASPCRKRCRGRFCRWLCAACRRRFCCLMQLCRLRQAARLYCLKQQPLASRRLPPGRVRPMRPVCRYHPARCGYRRGSDRSPTRRCLFSCRDGVAKSPRRRRDRDGPGSWRGVAPACRGHPAASSGRGSVRAGNCCIPRNSRFCP